jgi:hypothetical protein
MNTLRWCILAFAMLPLSGCGGAVSSGLPSNAAAAPISQTASRAMLPRAFAVSIQPAKVSGEWGVSAGDSVDAEYASTSPMTCSTPTGSVCNGYVEQRSFPDSLTVSGSDPSSGANDSGTITADAELGHLTGSVTATGTAGFIPPSTTIAASGQGTVNIQWIDTFKITSSTLPAGTPVTFDSTMTVKNEDALTCDEQDGEVYAGVVGAGGSNGALVYLKQCTSGKWKLQYTPVLTGTLNTTIGSTVNIYGWLNLYLTAQAGASPFPSSLTNKITLASSTFKLTAVTAGAGYKTASGKTY